jgi:hypothetical protein
MWMRKLTKVQKNLKSGTQEVRARRKVAAPDLVAGAGLDKGDMHLAVAKGDLLRVHFGDEHDGVHHFDYFCSVGLLVGPHEVGIADVLRAPKGELGPVPQLQEFELWIRLEFENTDSGGSDPVRERNGAQLALGRRGHGKYHVPEALA